MLWLHASFVVRGENDSQNNLSLPKKTRRALPAVSYSLIRSVINPPLTWKSISIHLSLSFSVSVILKERKGTDSVTLAWQGPEPADGAVVEYEVTYYEKVRHFGLFFSAH